MIQHWNVLLDIVVLMALATALGIVFERFRQSALIGYLIAGVVAGPGGLNLIDDVDLVHTLAELGVALLLFNIGLEFSYAKLKTLGHFAVSGGLLQIAGTWALFTLGAILFGMPTVQAIALGLILAPSSTAVVMRTLHDRSSMESIYGRNAVSILLLQDLVLVFLVLVIEAMGDQGSGTDILYKTGLTALLFAVFIGLFYIIIVKLFPSLFHATTRFKNRELMILLTTIIALGATCLAHTFGFSPSLGAFIVGLLIAGSPLSAQVSSDLRPFRAIFVTLFFVSIGMLGDLRWIVSHWPMVLGITSVILVGKTIVMIGVGLIFRHTAGNAIAAAICLAQVGEFSFLLAARAFHFQLLDKKLYQLLASAIVITMILTPYLVRLAPWFGSFFRTKLTGSDLSESSDSELKDHVIIAGYGPAAIQVAQTLKSHGIVVVVIEMNPDGVASAKRDDALAIFGDASMSIILKQAQLLSAQALVITIPDPHTAHNVIGNAKNFAPQVPIIVRSRYSRYTPDFLSSGATEVIDEEEQIGNELYQCLKKMIDQKNNSAKE